MIFFPLPVHDTSVFLMLGRGLSLVNSDEREWNVNQIMSIGGRIWSCVRVI